MIKKFKTVITSKRMIAENTSEISFDTSHIDFEFIAGQYVTITILSLSNLPVREQFRDFSIASSPHDHNIVTIAFRNSDSAFKRAILEGKIDSEIEIEGPKGVFTLPEDIQAPIVFVAGGIGIIPFKSIVQDVIYAKRKVQITLFYYNSDQKHAAYIDELQNLSSKNKDIVFIPVFGLFDGLRVDEFLRKSAILPSHWFVAGPPGFVSNARHALVQRGILDVQIRTEEFTGY